MSDNRVEPIRQETVADSPSQAEPAVAPQPLQPPTPAELVEASDALPGKGETKPDWRPLGIFVMVLIGIIFLGGLYFVYGLSNMERMPPPPTPAPPEVTAAAQVRATHMATARAVAPSLVREKSS